MQQGQQDRADYNDEMSIDSKRRLDLFRDACEAIKEGIAQANAGAKLNSKTE